MPIFALHSKMLGAKQAYSRAQPASIFAPEHSIPQALGPAGAEYFLS